MRTLPDPINLSIGQPDFPMPQAAREAACAATHAGKNGYTATQGIPELRERLEQDTRQQLGQPERTLCVTSGTSGGLVLTLMSLIDPGDEVILFEPAFVMYRPLVEFLGGRCVVIDTAPSFTKNAGAPVGGASAAAPFAVTAALCRQTSMAVYTSSRVKGFTR